ncbi:nucleotidyl transferase AbiEii/AbiGii toxin family protein [Polynucleobacter asymbioticus]|uniref:nucleotidyl transferase AbiEii/AbiGii toxin family protein n=1 Tax=Polynucleobacter asymbioticus TaxID=576611 RepID=UPI0008F91472|nr:nucleotidyl transferase AbiEii/AbiGii toxin family protein [Polynucleobacter asymbioticus]
MTDISLKLEISPDRPLKGEHLVILRIFDEVARSLNIDYFLAGAQARDLILGHVFNKRTGQATYDLDLGICLEDWAKFDKLKSSLISMGYFTEGKAPQKLHFKRPQDQYSTPLDLIPFGGVENLDSTIEWPPEMNVVMNVSGFSEALRSAILLKIAENFSIRVASLAGMAALKLIAWQDRGQENQGKDAVDFLLIAKSYHDAGNEDRIYTEELTLLESLEYDPELAGIQMLGKDVAKICLDSTKQSIDAIFSDSILRQRLTDQLTSNSLSIGDEDSVLKVHAHLDLFYKGFSSK